MIVKSRMYYNSYHSPTPTIIIRAQKGLATENIIILVFSKMSVTKQIYMLFVTEMPFSSFLGENIPFYNARNFHQMHVFFDDSKASILFQAIHVFVSPQRHQVFSQKRNSHVILRNKSFLRLVSSAMWTREYRSAKRV